MELRYLNILIMGMLGVQADAATYTQSLSLEPGWNSVWLYVEPVDDEGEVQLVDSVFTDADISIVARHVDGAHSIEYVSSLTEQTFSQEYWQVWWRDTPLDNSNLAAIDGGVAYLVYNAGNQAIDLDVEGEVYHRKPNWTADSYNFVGFSLSGAVTFSDAFSAVSETHPINKIFKLQADGAWLAVSDSDNMNDGEAYWIYCEGPSTFNGPISITDDFYQGIDFGTSEAMIEVDDPEGGVNPIYVSKKQLTVSNISDSTLPVNVNKVGPETGASSSDDLRIYDLTGDTDSLSYVLGNQWGNGNTLATVASGETESFFVAAHRNWSSGERERENLYYLDAGGFRYWLTVSAENQDLSNGSELTANADYAGLWLGEVYLDEVTDLTTSGRPVSGTSSTAGMRILLHADATGSVSLLSSVIAMQREATEEGESPEPVLVVDENKLDLFAGIEERGGRQVGIRIDSVAFDMPRKFDGETQAELFSDLIDSTNGGYGAELEIARISSSDLGFANLDGPHGVYVWQHYAYVLNFFGNALIIVDVEDPAAPVLVDVIEDDTDGFNYLESNDTNSTLQFIEADGYAYIVNHAQSAITIAQLDAATGLPTVVAEIVDGVGGFETLGGVRSVYVDSGYCYAVSESDDALTVIDVSNPASPTLVATLVDGDFGVTDFDNLRVVAGAADYLYVSSRGSNTLNVIDVSTPASPQLVTQLKDGQGGFDYLQLIFDLTVVGDVLYVLSFWDDALSAIDVSNPLSPTLLDTYRNTSVMSAPFSMGFYDDFLFIADIGRDSMVILDVTDPSDITLRDSYRDGVDFQDFDGPGSVAFYNDVVIAGSINNDALIFFYYDYKLADESEFRNIVNAASSRPIALAEEYHLSWPLNGGLGPDAVIATSADAPLNLDAFHRSNPFRHLFHQKHAAGYAIERAITIELDGDHEPGVLTGSYQEVVSGLASADLTTRGSIRLVKVSDVATLE